MERTGFWQPPHFDQEGSVDGIAGSSASQSQSGHQNSADIHSNLAQDMPESVEALQQEVQEAHQRISRILQGFSNLGVEPTVQVQDEAFVGALEGLNMMATNMRSGNQDYGSTPNGYFSSGSHNSQRDYFQLPQSNATSQTRPRSSLRASASSFGPGNSFHPGAASRGRTLTDRARTRNQERTAQRLRQAFGSREDIESEDYQSPIAAMFGRHWNGYEEAEGRRRERQPENNVSTFTSDAEAGPSTQPLPNWGSSEANGNTNIHSPYSMSTNPLRSPEDSPLLPQPIYPAYDSHNQRTQHNRNSSFTDATPMQTRLPARSRAAVPAIPMTMADQVAHVQQFSLFNTTLHPQRQQYVQTQAQTQYEHGLSVRQDELIQEMRERRAAHQQARGQEDLIDAPFPAPVGSRSGHQPIRLNPLAPTTPTAIPNSQPRHGPGYTAAMTYPLPRRLPETPPVTFDTQPRPAPLKDEQLRVPMACTVCMEQVIDTVLVPCGHACMCKWCADLWAEEKGSKSCPICRKTVQKRYKLWLP